MFCQAATRDLQLDDSVAKDVFDTSRSNLGNQTFGPRVGVSMQPQFGALFVQIGPECLKSLVRDLFGLVIDTIWRRVAQHDINVGEVLQKLSRLLLGIYFGIILFVANATFETTKADTI